MKKVKKGTPGYIRYEQKKRLLITLLMFVLPLGLYVIGYIATKTRQNLLTFVAILGCLPACKSMVSLIMIMMQKPISKEDAEVTAKAAGDLVSARELLFTTYEHNTPVTALAVCGNEVVLYTKDEKTVISQFEKHITKILLTNSFQSVNVKVFRDRRAYCQRVEHLRRNQEKYRSGIQFTPDERYPDLSRDELILHTLFAITL